MSNNRIHSILAGLRRGIRFYVLIETLARAAGAIALFSWLSLGLDFLTEMRPAFRAVILVSSVLALATFVFRSMLTKFFARLKLEHLALTVERLKPELGGGLISAIQLGRDLDAGDSTFSHALAKSAVERAVDAVKELRSSQFLDFPRLLKIFMSCIVLVMSWAAFVMLAKDSATIWFNRNILLSAEAEWPHKTDLQILGFDGKSVMIARGDDFSVRVLAGGEEVPPKVQIRYRMENTGTRGRAYLVKVGLHDGELTGAEFVHRFAGLLEPVSFEVRGGDDFEGPFTIETVPPPLLNDLKIHARYPEYTGLNAEVIDANALVYKLPTGSELRIEGTSTKELSLVRYTTDAAEHRIELKGTTGFSFSTRLEANTNINIALTDQHGIENREAVSLNLVARPDHPPEVDATLRGIRQSLTPKAIIPFNGTIKDEYGIQNASFRYRIDEQEFAEQPISVPGSAKELPLRQKFDVEPLKLQPSQKMQLQIVATDANTLGEKQEGTSKLFTFEIVTVDELLSQIGARELNLRRRFERALEEVRESTKDIEFTISELKTESPNLSNLKLYADRVLIGFRKNHNEVAGVSSSFNDILLELQNNRIENEDLLQRLDQGICIPLTDISKNSFPSVIERVQALSDALEKQEDAAVKAVYTSESAKILVDKMEKILAAMLEMEDFNEALDLLRDILQLQKKVDEDTKGLRKKRIRELLK